MDIYLLYIFNFIYQQNWSFGVFLGSCHETVAYFLKFFIHKLDASLQIVLYMVKITLTMEKQ